MKGLEESVCSWQQGKRLVELNINAESLFKWVHPYQLCKFIENKRKYILVESYKIANRCAYPAYTLEELLQLLPEEYILGRLGNRWFCESESDCFITADLLYEPTAIKACFDALVMWTLRSVRRRNKK
jgi:hypothetical protein